jgi:type II secretory ATPase GspE/PulE/Tfp pilus assembly ATPase PilB-like protein
MKVEPFLISSTLNLIIAQRLGQEGSCGEKNKVLFKRERIGQYFKILRPK